MAVQEIRNNPTSSAKRTVIAFPDIKTFYGLLQVRLNMTLSRFGFLRHPFTIILNALPREKTIQIDRFEHVVLNYAGVNKQRELLEGEPPFQDRSLDKYWSTLDRAIMLSESAVVGSELYQQFRDGKHDLKKIIALSGTLTDYFKLELSESEREKEYNIWQLCEYYILNKNFDIHSYRYLSLPLIQFGEFDGVAHIVYSSNDHVNMQTRTSKSRGELSKFVVGNIIKAFSSAYEGMILDWDLVGTNANKESAIRAALDAAIDPIFFKSFNNNPILNELGFQDFYKKYENYYKKRVEQSDVIPRERRKQHHKIAIMSILIDSYAHNVTAHSLTALEWWFRLRAEKFKRSGEESYEQFVEEYASNPVVSKDSLAIELYPLMKFLLDKGAFWTGLTRERSFGGKISSLFNVLWNDFVNNPLYLGTIAFSEGILKLNINITILEEDQHYNKVYLKKSIKRDEKGVLLDGNFVSIDLNKLSSPNSDKKPSKVSEFVIPGEKFESFKHILKKYKAFFPGGVVGRHAFFTILENEIRNVKHYPPDSISVMQKEGLTLNLSIEEDSYRGGMLQGGNSTYFKIGVWIKHPVRLTKYLINMRLNRLGEDIINEDTFKPKLGGTYQDKVCAAMLFNNTFTSVQDREGKRNMRYYPWMKVGGNFERDNDQEIIHDYEISWRRYTYPEHYQSREYYDRQFNTGTGYFKKFFHIWKGEDIYNISEADHFSSNFENYSRFRFICIDPNDRKQFRKVRKEGVFRIINESTELLEEAYTLWLAKWVKHSDKKYRILFKVNRQPAGHLLWDGNQVIFENRSQLKKINSEKRTGLMDPGQVILNEINLQHGSGINGIKDGCCRFRSHGVLKRHYLQGKPLHKAEIEKSNAAELFEILTTRVAIFDNRIANRIEKRVNKSNLENALNCFIFKEDVSLWREEQIRGFIDNYHFLVIHLSFIEAFRDEEGEKLYSEENIAEFIKKEILQYKTIPENFILVITTGRGRTQWWSSLELMSGEDFTHFTSFRPVESLIDSVENAINMEDDFELKYRLIKVLFGS